MEAVRKVHLGTLAAGTAQQLAFLLPDGEEGTFVASRLFALMYANAIDLKDMQDKGLTVDQVVENGLVQLRFETRAVLQERMLVAHVPATDEKPN